MSDLCWKVCDRAQSYYGSETLCKDYETETFLLCFIITFFRFVKVKKEDKLTKNFFISMTTKQPKKVYVGTTTRRIADVLCRI